LKHTPAFLLKAAKESERCSEFFVGRCQSLVFFRK
jgi:hypothetical protein